MFKRGWETKNGIVDDNAQHGVTFYAIGFGN
jgi:hypothetical protein